MIIEQRPQSQVTSDWFKVLKRIKKTNYLFYRIQHVTSLCQIQHYITMPREHLHVMNHSLSSNPFYHVNFPLSSLQTKKKRIENRREVRCKEVEKTHHMVESQKSASAVSKGWVVLNLITVIDYRIEYLHLEESWCVSLCCRSVFILL